MKKAITVGVYDPRLIYQISPYCDGNVFAKELGTNKYKVTSFYRSMKSSAHWCIDLLETKIGIGVNSYNRSKYSSDRLGNYMACGAFYLAHYILGIIFI